jgi:hypothetical protein
MSGPNRVLEQVLDAAAQDPGQQQPPPQQVLASGQPYQTENPEQLQQLVAPMALYPDSLVASILAASSYPSEVAQANDFLAARQNFTPEQIASDADKQSWWIRDRSVSRCVSIVRRQDLHR